MKSGTEKFEARGAAFQDSPDRDVVFSLDADQGEVCGKTLPRFRRRSSRRSRRGQRRRQGSDSVLLRHLQAAPKAVGQGWCFGWTREFDCASEDV